jgi:hypothetical protein
MAKRAVTKKLGWAGLSAAGVILCVIGLFVYQQVQIAGWQAKKSSLDAQSKDVRLAQAQINKYNAWFDNSYRALNIMRTMANCFSRNGAVTAKSLRISSLTDVTCAGVAQNNQAITVVVDNLAKTPGVKQGSVSVPSQSGTPPNIQFNLNFQWEGETSGN